MSSTAPGAKHHNPVYYAFAGLLALAACLYATLLEIQASEAWSLHSSIVSYSPNWDILRQPYFLFVGGLDAAMAKAAMWGWGSEIVFLVCILCYEAAHEAVHGMNKHMAPWFRTGAFAIVIFNLYTNYSYGTLGSGLVGQLVFALLTSFCAGFLGIVGIRLLSIAANNIR